MNIIIIMFMIIYTGLVITLQYISIPGYFKLFYKHFIIFSFISQNLKRILKLKYFQSSQFRNLQVLNSWVRYRQLETLNPKKIFIAASLGNLDTYLFVGDIEDEDEVLTWLTDEETLEIPGRIEEVNTKMLEKILSENENVVVFFCK